MMQRLATTSARVSSPRAFRRSLTDGREALTQATLQSYDLFLFDRMLPGLDGLSLLKSLRAAQVATPAILLTSMGAVDDRVAGLRAGADDYMVKPFAFAELLARIDTIARRPGLRAEVTELRQGDLHLDLLTREANRAGIAIDLQPREFPASEALHGTPRSGPDPHYPA